MTGIIIACGGSIITAIVAITTLLLNRKWQKEDRTADRITELSGKINDVQTTLNAHIKSDAENDAKQARRRIISFSDECRRGLQHSEEHFTSILDDITDYKYYCEHVNPKFKNEKAVHSIKFIEEVYAKAQKENKFI
jgi:hypothetical protein